MTRTTMLRVVDLVSGAALSCSLTRESTVSQVVLPLKKRRGSGQGLDDMPFCALYAIWCDPKQRLHAKKLRIDDHPLLIVEHLKRTTGVAPKLNFSQGLVAARLIIANLAPEEEAAAFARRGIILGGPGDSEFFSTIQKLGNGDICGFLLTNSADAVSKKVDSGLRWWVLLGEKLWFQPSVEDDARTQVHLANNKVQGPWGAEFELQTPTNVYRLIAANAKDSRAWVDAISSRIVLATENEMISSADVLVADEERVLWKRVESILNGLDTLEGWCSSQAASSELCRFARLDGTEYLLLFYLDTRSAIANGEFNDVAIVRRFLALVNLPSTLLDLKQDLNSTLSRGLSTITPLTIRLLMHAVHDELEQGLLQRLKGKPDMFDRLVSELPVLLTETDRSL